MKKTDYDSSAIEVMEHGLCIEMGIYDKTKVGFHFPDGGDYHGDELDSENSGEMVWMDVCDEGAPSFMGEYRQAKAVARLVAAAPALARALEGLLAKPNSLNAHFAARQALALLGDEGDS